MIAVEQLMQKGRRDEFCSWGGYQGSVLAPYASQLSVLLTQAAGRSRKGLSGWSRCITYTGRIDTGSKWALSKANASFHAIYPYKNEAVQVASSQYLPGLLLKYKVWLNLRYFSALTSPNLQHSDLLRMERSRITQSHPVITWPRHATHSWFQYRCQQKKKRERGK